MKKRKETYAWKDRFNYWFDNHMAKGSLGFIRFLIMASIMMAILMAGLIILFGFNEKGEIFSVFWDSLATIINAWMPSFADGSIGYLLIMSLTAIAGVLFTSVLIGIVTSAIEAKIQDLRKGNSLVLESDHIVVLGFKAGEYTLVEQLILAAEGEKVCIVIADGVDKSEMEQAIDENITVPDNCQIVCRTIDITDPASIERCAIDTCRTIIISPSDDTRVVKTILAVMHLMEERGITDKRINCILSKDKYHMPLSMAQAHNISPLQTNRILAKMMAHSCTQRGLSETFREIFNFEACEFHAASFELQKGMTFAALMDSMNGGVPIGIIKEDNVILNPSYDTVLSADDQVLFFAENSHAVTLETSKPLTHVADPVVAEEKTKETNAFIIGFNGMIYQILRELPDHVKTVYLVSEMTQRQFDKAQRICDNRNITLCPLDFDLRSEESLHELAHMADHIIILGDHQGDEDETDMHTILLMMNLHDIRQREHLSFHMTVEMQKEQNQKLADCHDDTDFLVSSSMSSLILAQIAEKPILMDVFREILSHEGNELYLKSAFSLNLQGTYQVQTIRHLMLKHGYIYLGKIDEKRRSYFHLYLDETVTLDHGDDLIVLGID